MTLHIGKIDYLNIWHVFELLAQTCPHGPDFHYVPGHPGELNQALATGDLHLSPSSSFEYLLRAESYTLLPNASISAQKEVQSVLFLSPVPVEQLPLWLVQNPGPVCLTNASATSTALLKVLWSQKWNFAQPQWQDVHPGQGLSTGRPFLEIGNLALQHFIECPPGYYIYDLATEWNMWTGLPFVFAVWIVRRNLNLEQSRLVARLAREIHTIILQLDRHFTHLSTLSSRPPWLQAQDLIRYWQAMSYGLGPKEQAGLTLFGERCTQEGLLPGMPGLIWFSEEKYPL